MECFKSQRYLGQFFQTSSQILVYLVLTIHFLPLFLPIPLWFPALGPSLVWPVDPGPAHYQGQHQVKQNKNQRLASKIGTMLRYKNQDNLICMCICIQTHHDTYRLNKTDATWSFSTSSTQECLWPSDTAGSSGHCGGCGRYVLQGVGPCWRIL